MIIATTSSLSILKDMEFKQTFNVITHVPSVSKPEHVVRVFQLSNVKIDEKEMDIIAKECALPIGIKQMMMLIEMAKVTGQNMTAARFLECMHDSGIAKKKTAASTTLDFSD
jgi:hypothetical protein